MSARRGSLARYGERCDGGYGSVGICDTERNANFYGTYNDFFFFVVVVVVVVTKLHTTKKVRWEKCCVSNFFLLTKTNFFLPPKNYRQHSDPISSKPPFPYPKPLVLHLVKLPKRKMAHGILKQLANFNQIAGSHFLRMMGGKWCLTLARDRVSPLEEGFDRVLDAKWPISNCVCC